MLWDLEARAKMLVEKFPDVVQVLAGGRIVRSGGKDNVLNIGS